ncbi:MAG: fasciclin domain-containing protein, partial [Cytophagales bacterium]|nr:fasciclin domain-containing protein [Cytophagales bacterium]
LWVPSEAAFITYFKEKQLSSLSALSDTAAWALCQRHVVPGTALPLRQLAPGLPITNLRGENLSLELGADTLLNQAPLRSARSDRYAQNGVLHELEAVLD